MKGGNKILLIGVVSIVILALGAGAFIYFQKGGEEEKEEGVKSFSDQIFDAIKGPAERIPEINPFKRVKLNPFE